MALVESPDREATSPIRMFLALDLPVHWKPYPTVVKIDLLYVSDCPNRSLTRRVVELALARARQPAIVREREVRSGEEAERLGMRGSPTILIDGHDPFAGGAEP